MSVEKLNEYHRIRRFGEFPSPTTVGGFFSGAAVFGIGAEAIFHNLRADLVGTLAGAVAGATLGFILDRRASKAATDKFLSEFVENQNSTS